MRILEREKIFVRLRRQRFLVSTWRRHVKRHSRQRPHHIVKRLLRRQRVNKQQATAFNLDQKCSGARLHGVRRRAAERRHLRGMYRCVNILNASD